MKPSFLARRKKPESPSNPVAVGHEHAVHCTALCCARAGQCVLIEQLCNDAAEAARLRDLGLCEGAQVEILRHGHPIVVRVCDARFGLAHKVAEKVLCRDVDSKVDFEK